MKDIFKSQSILLICIPIVLSIIGVLFIMSTGQSDTGQSDLYIRQIVWIIIGIFVSIFLLSIDYYYLVETSIIYYFIGLGLLILTIVIGREVKGAQSWIGIGGFGIQSSEIMKIFFILFYAKFLKNTPKDEKEFTTFYKSIFYLAPPVLLILLQPDLGTAIVFLGIYTVMSFLGMRQISILLSILMIGFLTGVLMMLYTYYHFYYTPQFDNIVALDILLSANTFIAIAVILLIYAVITFIIELIQPIEWIHKFTRGSLILGLSFLGMGVVSSILKPYQWNRLLVFINPEFDKLGSGYNVIQAQIAIGSGGISGQGLFKGSQNLRGFLPEKHTDFIFSILAEEWGFIGAFTLILLYVIYLIFILRTIFSAKDAEGSYIAGGIFALFLTHIFINIGMNLGVAPVTGLPLPFISYGGSFYLTCISASAIIINIYSRRFVH